MRLTRFSDYSLRVLMYAASRGEGLITIEETAATYRISRTHLMKVCHQLTRAGFLRAIRGRSGGLVLARAPSEIGIGEVLRLTEPDFALVELTLYLDTHPNDMQAVQQFNQLSQRRRQIAHEFEIKYGPLLQFGLSYSRFPWQWIDTPWPWQV